MGKFKPYSQRELRRRRANWLRRNVIAVALVVVGITVLLSLMTGFVLTAMTGEFRLYLLGVAHAGLAAAGLHRLHSAFLANDREPFGMSAAPGGRTTPAASCSARNEGG